MDQAVAKQLIRKLKIMNFWITFFGVLFLAIFAIVAVLIFKMVAFVHTSEQKISDIQSKTQSTLNVQQLCDNKSLSTFLSSTCH